jgi:two-component sensor histidine kinase
MALIHEVLYESGDLAGINLKEYLSRLTDSLTRMYGASGERIRLDIEPDELTLKIDASVPCGLAINELISNSIKHAHPDGRLGAIDIRVRVADGGEIVFVVADDGIGIPADLDVRKTGSMGMGIVLALVEKQLGGRLSIDRSRGTTVTIAIPFDGVAV